MSYSIAAQQWPEVRVRREERLDRPNEPRALGSTVLLSPRQVDDLMDMYRREWWTFAERGSGRLVAFSRVITDYVYKALVFDVSVDAEFRGRGLEARLIDTIVGDRELAGVRHFEPCRREELKPFYRRGGFEDTARGICFLRRG